MLIVPPENAAEAGQAGHANPRLARTLFEVCVGLGSVSLGLSSPSTRQVRRWRP